MFKNSQGFTLIEMLIVLMIISVLIILIVPSLTGSSKDVQDKGCDALVGVVQTQVNLYQLDEGRLPASISSLVSNGYITSDQTECSNGDALVYNDGVVSRP